MNPAVEVSVIEDSPVVITTPEGSDNRNSLPQLRIVLTAFSTKAVFYTLVFVLIALTLFIYGKKNTWKTREIDPLYSRVGNSCQIVYLNNTSDAIKTQLNIKAMAYLEERDRECSDNDIFIVSVVNTEHSGGIERSFLSLCRGDSEGKIIDCNSLYSRR